MARRKIDGRTLLTVVAICWLSLADATAALGSEPATAANARLEQYLRDYLGAANKDTRYAASLVDLNGDGEREWVVYLQGAGWCGSGGCTTLILSPGYGTYRVVGKVSVSRTPIRLLATTSHGWRDIGVLVSGGGIQPGYEAALSFDGRRYPGDPTTPPARVLKGFPGRILISDSAPGRPVWP